MRRSSDLFLFLQTCNGINPTTNPHICSPSACGVIRNISFPFRLKHDPKHCGYHNYELACESNITLINLNSKKHQVKAINYDNFTVRVVAATTNNNTCSVPNYSAYKHYFTDPYSYRSGWNLNYTEVAWPINYMSCPHPLNNSSFLAVTNDCADVDKVPSTNRRYAYIKVGHMNASQVEHMCRIDLIALTSWKFDDLKKVSNSEVRESLLYGFELSWFMYPCGKCKKRSYCVLSMDHTATCPGESYHAGFLIFVLVVVVFAGVSVPAMIIAGFTCAWVLYMDRSASSVKLLGKPGGNGQDFMNEIATIGRIHHVNVVNLVGYCAERSKRALVFDFMPNGSLDKYIYSPEKANCLSWEKKYEIAVGVARGIAYLHTGCDIQILHFDIKPHNILLDDNFTPKITDFGLAKFYSTDKNMVTMTTARGTIGYVAPELINRGFGGVSCKADIYSFGMLLMEMVGLNKNIKGNNQASSQYFPCWIYDYFEQGQDIEIGVTDDDNDDINKKIARKMSIVALWCIQMSPDNRPSMNKVVEMLESQVEQLRVPDWPSQSAQVAIVNDEDESWSTYSIDSISLLCHETSPSIEITVED